MWRGLIKAESDQLSSTRSQKKYKKMKLEQTSASAHLVQYRSVKAPKKTLIQLSTIIFRSLK